MLLFKKKKNEKMWAGASNLVSGVFLLCSLAERSLWARSRDLYPVSISHHVTAVKNISFILACWQAVLP